ncbi:hypothetical protein MUP77_01350 [Candidatus Bathyarchaeota archaeon]|nr:hypothetical protein [Candidatus Bathyarchaeota archaeon]
MIVKQLVGHESEETAYVIADYPWGFRMRTEQKVWIETTKHGQRIVRRTKDPRTGLWCKSKASTYSEVLVMGIDEVGHVDTDAIGIYTAEDKLDEFKSKYQLSEQQLKQLDICRAYTRASAKGTWSCHVVAKMIDDKHYIDDEGVFRESQTLKEQAEIIDAEARFEYAKIKSESKCLTPMSEGS